MLIGSISAVSSGVGRLAGAAIIATRTFFGGVSRVSSDRFSVDIALGFA